MNSAYNQFIANMNYVAELDSVYVHLKDVLHLPNDLSDLLRAEWVYTISAMDRLIHELIRIGMIESFLGIRPKTRKFLTFSISTDTYSKISSATPTSVPPPEYWFEQEVIQKNRVLSFQEPAKISDGLSLIWDEDHKWNKISTAIGMPEADLKTKLKTIISRRNQIVHEADLDLNSGLRNPIDKADVDDVVTFIRQISEAIYNEVK